MSFLKESFLERMNKYLLVEDIEAVKRYYPTIKDFDFDRLIRLDPTFKEEKDSVGNYGKWILNLFKKDKIKDENHIKDILTRFEEVKNQLKNRDINIFKSEEDLENYLNNEENYNKLSDRQELRKVQNKIHNTNIEQDADLVFEDNKWEVWIPKTYEASCKLGQGTTWCTATNSSNHYYKQYTKEGPLYININKNNPKEKYQFHFETESFMDKDDRSIKSVNFLIENPSLYKFYGNKLDVDLRDEIKEIEDFKKDNPEKIFYYDSEKNIADELRPYIKKVVIKDGIKKINDYAFMCCTGLTSIKIPDSVTSIGEYAFYECISLKSIVLPNNLKEIENYLFSRCHSLMDMIIPSNITSIGSEAFDGCSKLANITIPDNVTNIGKGAFQDCTNLMNVTFTKNSQLTSIEEFTFNNCVSLTSITIPKSITSIGRAAFYYCKSLTNIEIPDSVTSIGHDAFAECTSLTSITIPSGVTSLGDYVFYNCNKLKTIYFDGTKKQWEKLTENKDLGIPKETKIIVKEDESLKESLRRNKMRFLKENINNILDKAYNESYYTIIGAGGDINEWKEGYQDLLDKENIGKIKEWVEFTGKDVNDKYNLEGENAFQDDLHFLAFPLTGLDVQKLSMFKLKMQDRWFDDIIDNATGFYDKHDDYDESLKHRKSHRKIRESYGEEIDKKLEKYEKSGKFNRFQLKQIQWGLESQVDVSKYANPKFNDYQMGEIRRGLEYHVDISKYADPRFNADQMEQIREGLEDNLDVSKYADPKFNWRQMQQIAIGLDDGLDISKYADPKYTWQQMDEIREQLEKGTYKDSTKKDENLDEAVDIEVDHPGILEVPKDKKVWELPLTHFIKLVDKKGYDEVIRALNNLQVWNKNDDKKLSDWAKHTMDRLKRKFRPDGE